MNNNSNNTNNGSTDNENILKNTFSNIKKVPNSLEKEIVPSDFYGCKKCNYTGFISSEDNGYKFSKPCECYLKHQINKRKERCNIPEIYLNSSLNLDEGVRCYRFMPSGFTKSEVKDSFGNKIVKRVLDFAPPVSYDINKLGQQYVKVQNNNLEQTPRTRSVSLLLSGTVGSGKTMFACAIGNEFIKKNLNVYYIKTKQYIDNVIKDSYNASQEKTESLKKLRDFLNGFNKNEKENCHLLILDELGYEYQKEGSSYALAEIKDLLRNRAEKLYPTIITTNFTFPELSQCYEEELVSMFCESYMFLNIICNDDYRVKMSHKLDEDFDIDGLLK